jgi:hypothetical protein
LLCPSPQLPSQSRRHGRDSPQCDTHCTSPQWSTDRHRAACSEPNPSIIGIGFSVTKLYG